MGYDFTGGRIFDFPIDFCTGLNSTQLNSTQSTTVQRIVIQLYSPNGSNIKKTTNNLTKHNKIELNSLIMFQMQHD